ncbi:MULTISPECIES: hypothetical protein [unclassified Oleiphilus]|nr:MULTISPECIES: hypothetical protein [unclassified Oleiphilus]
MKKSLYNSYIRLSVIVEWWFCCGLVVRAWIWRTIMTQYLMRVGGERISLVIFIGGGSDYLKIDLSFLGLWVSLAGRVRIALLFDVERMSQAFQGAFVA